MDGGAEKGSLAAAAPLPSLSLLPSLRWFMRALVVIRLNKRRHPLRLTYHYQIPPPSSLPSSPRACLVLTPLFLAAYGCARTHIYYSHPLATAIVDKKKMGEDRQTDGGAGGGGGRRREADAGGKGSRNEGRKGEARDGSGERRKRPPACAACQ